MPKQTAVAMARYPKLSASLVLLQALRAQGGSITQAEKDEVLAVHNKYRCLHGLGQSSLAWDAGIAADAQAWADSLAATGQFYHNSSELQSKGQGENLAMRWGSSTPYAALPAAAAWYNEIQYTSPYGAPTSSDCSKSCAAGVTGQMLGHYTALVWKDTTLLGCGRGQGTLQGMPAFVWSCRYKVAGNVYQYSTGLFMPGKVLAPTVAPSATVSACNVPLTTEWLHTGWNSDSFGATTASPTTSGGAVTTTVAATTAGGVMTTTAAGSSASSPGLSQAEKDEMLDVHNKYRCLHGYGPTSLFWDDVLATDAQAYAAQLAATGTFQHNSTELRSKGQGENLAMRYGSTTPYAALPAASAWYNEIQYTSPYGAPTSSSCAVSCAAGVTGQQLGHYTALLWTDTTLVGCGRAQGVYAGLPSFVWSCRYKVAGNVYQSSTGLFAPGKVLAPTIAPSATVSTCSVPLTTEWLHAGWNTEVFGATTAPATTSGPATTTVAAATGEGVVTTTAAGSSASGGLSQAERAEILDVHNKYRCLHGLGRTSLVWDDGVAADAQAYAEQLAATGTFSVNSTDLRIKGQGENLALRYGSTTPYAPLAAASNWYNEIQYTSPYGAPTSSSCTKSCAAGVTGQALAHYTQMLWTETTLLGCGRAQGVYLSKPSFVWSCRYKVAGNIIQSSTGLFSPGMVLAPTVAPSATVSTCNVPLDTTWLHQGWNAAADTTTTPATTAATTASASMAAGTMSKSTTASASMSASTTAPVTTAKASTAPAATSVASTTSATSTAAEAFVGQSQLLNALNSLRRCHDAPKDLVWDVKLELLAKSWVADNKSRASTGSYTLRYYSSTSMGDVPYFVRTSNLKDAVLDMYNMAMYSTSVDANLRKALYGTMVWKSSAGVGCARNGTVVACVTDMTGKWGAWNDQVIATPPTSADLSACMGQLPTARDLMALDMLGGRIDAPNYSDVRPGDGKGSDFSEGVLVIDGSRRLGLAAAAAAGLLGAVFSAVAW